jgi:hypothetical protein
MWFVLRKLPLVFLRQEQLCKIGMRVEELSAVGKKLLTKPLKPGTFKIIKKAGITAGNCSYPNL